MSQESGQEVTQSSPPKHQVVHSRDRPFSCDLCPDTFSRSTQLKQHKRSHTGDTCDQRRRRRRAQPDGLTQHGTTHSTDTALKTQKRIHKSKRNSKTYECEYCEKPFGRRSQLREHVFTHTGYKPFKCDQCERTFTRAFDLKRHKVIHVEKGYSCDVCSMKFLNVNSLIKHQKKIHSSTHGAESLYSCNNSSRPFKCEYCEKSFIRQSQLREHAYTHTGYKPYKCDQCERTFTRAFDLKRHKDIHVEEGYRYTCDICGMKFPRANSLKVHLENHSEKKPFGCANCKATFDFLYELKEHQCPHPGPKFGKCVRCGTRFSQLSNLKRHMRCHVGQPAYPCDQCGRVFNDPSTLRTHHLVHSGSYACDKCERSFTTEENLQGHRILHTEEEHFPAVELSKVESIDDLPAQGVDDVCAVEVDSFQVEEFERSCEVCSETFNTKGQYYEHLQNHEIELVVI